MSNEQDRDDDQHFSWEDSSALHTTNSIGGADDDDEGWITVRNVKREKRREKGKLKKQEVNQAQKTKKKPAEKGGQPKKKKKKSSGPLVHGWTPEQLANLLSVSKPKKAATKRKNTQSKSSHQAHSTPQTASSSDIHISLPDAAIQRALQYLLAQADQDPAIRLNLFADELERITSTTLAENGLLRSFLNFDEPLPQKPSGLSAETTQVILGWLNTLPYNLVTILCTKLVTMLSSKIPRTTSTSSSQVLVDSGRGYQIFIHLTLISQHGSRLISSTIFQNVKPNNPFIVWMLKLLWRLHPRAALLLSFTENLPVPAVHSFQSSFLILDEEDEDLIKGFLKWAKRAFQINPADELLHSYATALVDHLSLQSFTLLLNDAANESEDYRSFILSKLTRYILHLTTPSEIQDVFDSFFTTLPSRLPQIHNLFTSLGASLDSNMPLLAALSAELERFIQRIYEKPEGLSAWSTEGAKSDTVRDAFIKNVQLLRTRTRDLHAQAVSNSRVKFTIGLILFVLMLVLGVVLHEQLSPGN